MDFPILERALWFIVAISVLVAAHEFGHFIVARKLGFKVLRFSIGFGRPLLAWRGGPPDHIQYWLSMIPLGGYVKMLDEHEGPVVAADRHRAFHQRPVWQRVAVLLAGPAFNFLFAILAYWLMFVTGVQALKPFVAGVEPDSVAARAGLRARRRDRDDRRRDDADVGERHAAHSRRAARRRPHRARGTRAERRHAGASRSTCVDASRSSRSLRRYSAVSASRLARRPIVGSVVDGSPAERAGLEPHDVVIRGNEEPIQDWPQWVEFLQSRPGETVEVTVLRGTREVTVTATLESVTEDGRTFGRIGANRPEFFAEQRYGVLEALPRGVEKTWEVITFTVSMVAHMITGDVSLKNMSGPLSIADIAGSSANAGLAVFLSFLAAVSISLGILNLLPIPLLDGGQIVYQLAEWVKGAPLSERAMVIGQQIGIFFVIALTGFAFYNDIVRLFGS